jgi:ribonuclease HI
MSRTTYTLYFAGTSQGGRGEGSCGAVLVREDVSQRAEIWRAARCLGETTTLQAEFMGLILGLRRTLSVVCELASSPFSRLSICSDSVEVVSHVRAGDAAGTRTRSLTRLKAIVRGLMQKFPEFSVTVDLVGYEENVEAISCACSAVSAEGKARQYKIYHPNLASYFRGQANGVQVIMSNDMGASVKSGVVFIDAGLVVRLPGFGMQALEKLLDPGELSYVVAKVKMTILGVLPESLEIRIVEFGDSSVALSGALVVDRLPVPLHISLVHKDVEKFLIDHDVRLRSTPSVDSRLEAHIFDPEYRSHPYWRTRATFAPFVSLARQM